jgi:hypothetical protein
VEVSNAASSASIVDLVRMVCIWRCEKHSPEKYSPPS